MSFLVDVQELKENLVIFHRTDVQHHNWYCRVRVPSIGKYKTISLKTDDINQAKERAFDHDADIRFRVKHGVPVFDQSFEELAQEYLERLKNSAAAGQITMRRWKTVEAQIRVHLVPYMGNHQVVHVKKDKWLGYPLWRKENGKGLDGKVKDGTIRAEMVTFRAIMSYGAEEGYIREENVPKKIFVKDNGQREEFTPSEYRHLHTTARKWVTEGKNEMATWYRMMAYHYMLIMTNTGMRTMEARNLRWRDVDTRIDAQGRLVVAMNVRGKSKYRQLVAANNVAIYLDRIRAISKATESDDHVFTTYEGKRSSSLYDGLIADLLIVSGLLYGSAGTRRSAYCFRHTYGSFRYMGGLDVYSLANQMGTSVRMIEKHYGHITPTKNAERILQGIPGWEPMDEARGVKTGGVNADPAGSKAKPRTKKGQVRGEGTAPSASARPGAAAPWGRSRSARRPRPD